MDEATGSGACKNCAWVVPAHTQPHRTVPLVGSLVVHLDLDSFFASVERALRPELRDVPVVVGAARGQGMVVAATWDAKQLGVKVGMTFAEARRCAPGAAAVRSRMDAYLAAGAHVRAIVASTGACLETLGTDECFVALDTVDPEVLGQSADPYDQALRFVHTVRDKVRTELALAVSAGVGSNKTTAKLATDLAKPDGVRVLGADEELAVLHAQPVGAITGVGARTVAALEPYGVRTVADLAAFGESGLVTLFGPHHGRWLHSMSHNADPTPVAPNPEQRRMSVSRAVRKSQRELSDLFEALLGELLEKLTRTGRSARCVTVTFMRDGRPNHAHRRFREAIADNRELARAARACWAELGPPRDGVELLTLTLDQLQLHQQLSLDVAPGDTGDEPPVLVTPPVGGVASSAYHGMVVRHPVFGEGAVVELSGGMLLVRFSDRERFLDPDAPLVSCAPEA